MGDTLPLDMMDEPEVIPEVVPKLGTGEIMLALRARYSGNEWAYFENVASNTGSAARYADAVVMGLWHSRGLELQGFEVKQSRADWLRELKDPAKADRIGKYCDRWWIVVGHPSIVVDGELPPTWGLMVPKGTGLAVKVKAPKLESIPMTRGFLAALLRRASESDTVAQAITQSYAKGCQETRARLEKDWKTREERLKDGFRELEESVAEFEQKSGLRIHKYYGGNIAEAVRTLTSGQSFSERTSNLRYLRQQFGTMVASIDRAVEEFEELERMRLAGPRYPGLPR